VHVDPIKPVLKAPVTKRLKLINDEPPSNFAFKINLRSYNEALENRPLAQHWYKAALASDPFCFEAFEALITNHMLTVRL
jgi:hypothetical protein